MWCVVKDGTLTVVATEQLGTAVADRAVEKPVEDQRHGDSACAGEAGTDDLNGPVWVRRN